MKLVPLLLAAVAAFTTIGAAAPAKPSPVVSGNTTHGFRFGSLSARTKLIEYGSLNCSTCGAFAAQADASIVRAVKSGRLLFEFRPLAVFPQDLPAHALLRCVPAGARLSFIDDYYRNQRSVYERLEAAGSDDKTSAALNAALSAGEVAAARKLAEVGGMLPIAARHGLTPAAANRCLGNPANLRWVVTATQAANAAGVTGTPTFDLNGKRAATADVLALLKR